MSAHHGPAFLFASEHAAVRELARDLATIIAGIGVIPLLHIDGLPWDGASRRFFDVAAVAIVMTVLGAQLL